LPGTVRESANPLAVTAVTDPDRTAELAAFDQELEAMLDAIRDGVSALDDLDEAHAIRAVWKHLTRQAAFGRNEACMTVAALAVRYHRGKTAPSAYGQANQQGRRTAGPARCAFHSALPDAPTDAPDCPACVRESEPGGGH
jgi:hypothetical protein